MKYDLRKIMKRAWEIKKENSKNIFSLCLKIAWEEAKKETSLPKLVGTPKQVAWAEKLRERHLEILRRELERANAERISRGQKPLSGKRLKVAMTETSAVYFINQRFVIENYQITSMSESWVKWQKNLVKQKGENK